MSDSLKFRFLQATASDFKEARGRKTLRVCFSSEAPVLRVGNGNTNAAGAKFYEVLSHDPEHADLSLLQGSGAFLDEHDSAAQIGSVRRAWLDGDRKGPGNSRFW